MKYNFLYWSPQLLKFVEIYMKRPLSSRAEVLTRASKWWQFLVAPNLIQQKKKLPEEMCDAIYKVGISRFLWDCSVDIAKSLLARAWALEATWKEPQCPGCFSNGIGTAKVEVVPPHPEMVENVMARVIHMELSNLQYPRHIITISWLVATPCKMIVCNVPGVRYGSTGLFKPG